MNVPSLRPSAEKLAVLFIAIVSAHYARQHYLLISFPYQAEYREGAILLNMDLFSRGGNIFSVLNKPLHAEAYGIMYYIISYPVTALFGLSLIALRGVTALTIVLTCFLVFLLSHRSRRDFCIPAIIAGLCYPAALFFVNPLARPDGLGALLFLAAIAIPWWHNFSYVGLAASVLIATAAFLTKAYFGLSFVIIASFLFFFVSVYRSLAFTALSFVTLVAAYILASQLYPTYLYELLATSSDGLGDYSFAYAWTQLFGYLEAYWSFFAIFLCITLLATARRFHIMLNMRRSGVEIKKHFAIHVEYFFFASLISLGACLYPLGGNPGAYMTYFFQLITPCLAIAIGKMLSEELFASNLASHAVRVGACLMLCANMVTLKSWSIRSFDWERSAIEWQRVEMIVATYKSVLNPPALVNTVSRQNMPVYDSGLSSSPASDTRYVRIPEGLRLRVAIWNEGIAELIRSRKFDLIVSVGNEMPAGASKDLVFEHYEKKTTSTVSMPSGQQWVLHFWTPRPGEH